MIKWVLLPLLTILLYQIIQFGKQKHIIMKNFLLTFSMLLLAHYLKADVIISQYYEGSSFNKWIEISNVGASSASLDGLYLALFSNANADNPDGVSPNNKFTLSGSLASGVSILFQNSSSVLPSYASGTNTTICNFNGDDLVIISTTDDNTAWSNRIDVIGNGNNWGTNKSFFRDAGILSANTTYTPSEWIQVSNSVVDNAMSGVSERLGEHEANIPLPISLISFDAKPTFDNSINLTWQTASEENNDYFSIEHSIDGISFREIETQAGNGTTNAIQSYSFLHEEIESGLHYYRLKQVDFDEKFGYSNIITTTIKRSNDEVILTPNPTSNVILIQTKTPFERDADFQILNMQGQVVLSSILQEGTDNLEVNVSNFPVGIYYLQLFVDNEVMMKKIIKH
jgi:hypothetical protein